MKASIIIITKNNEKDITALLQALAIQDFKNFEVILVDFCSTDQTIARASSFPIKVIRMDSNQDYNFSQAINLAASVSRGKIIFCFKGNAWYTEP